MGPDGAGLYFGYISIHNKKIEEDSVCVCSCKCESVPGSGSSVYCGVFGFDRELIPRAVEARIHRQRARIARRIIGPSPLSSTFVKLRDVLDTHRMSVLSVQRLTNLL